MHIGHILARAWLFWTGPRIGEGLPIQLPPPPSAPNLTLGSTRQNHTHKQPIFPCLGASAHADLRGIVASCPPALAAALALLIFSSPPPQPTFPCPPQPNSLLVPTLRILNGIILAPRQVRRLRYSLPREALPSSLPPRIPLHSPLRMPLIAPPSRSPPPPLRLNTTCINRASPRRLCAGQAQGRRQDPGRQKDRVR